MGDSIYVLSNEDKRPKRVVGTINIGAASDDTLSSPIKFNGKFDVELYSNLVNCYLNYPPFRLDELLDGLSDACIVLSLLRKLDMAESIADAALEIGTIGMTGKSIIKTSAVILKNTKASKILNSVKILKVGTVSYFKFSVWMLPLEFAIWAVASKLKNQIKDSAEYKQYVFTFGQGLMKYLETTNLNVQQKKNIMRFVQLD